MFLVVKFSIYLNRRVFVMHTYIDEALFFFIKLLIFFLFLHKNICK